MIQPANQKAAYKRQRISTRIGLHDRHAAHEKKAIPTQWQTVVKVQFFSGMHIAKSAKCSNNSEYQRQQHIRIPIQPHARTEHLQHHLRIRVHPRSLLILKRHRHIHKYKQRNRQRKCDCLQDRQPHELLPFCPDELSK